MPYLISISYSGTLLNEILSMPSGKPISFEQAVNLTCDKFYEPFGARRIGKEPGECNWYYKNFVAWISSLGYQIEITGDEFESAAMTDRLA